MVSKVELAREATRIEQDVLKETVGCQDQISAAFGGFNRIDFLKNGTFDVNPVIIERSRLDQLQGSLMLFFTGQTRFASAVAKDKVNNLSRKVQELKAMQEMVDEALSILSSSGDMVTDFGKLMHESWKYKRGLAVSISNDYIDEIYASAMDAGAVGGKILGAGGGGFMLFVVPKDRQAHVRERLKKLVHVSFQFENWGSKVLVYDMNNGDNQ